MKIAAFDLGSTWAVASNAIPGGSCGHEDLNPGRGKKAARQRPEILGLFMEHVRFDEGFLSLHDIIVQSRPFLRGEAATRLLAGMGGILEAEAHNAGCATMMFSDREIKKWATGSGKAEKAAMIAAAQQLGYTGDNEHEADAWCLLKFAEATLTKEPAGGPR